MHDADNPYAAPKADLGAPKVFLADRRPVLASRMSRLAAQILNQVFLGVCMVPLVVGIFVAVAQQHQRNPNAEPDLAHPATLIGGAITLCAALVLLGFHLHYLGLDGQSLGKRVVGVKIVRTDGSPASLGRLLGLRYFVTQLIGAAPYVGTCFALVNIFAIFTEERRCLHDHIADTIVVDA